METTATAITDLSPIDMRKQLQNELPKLKTAYYEASNAHKILDEEFRNERDILNDAITALENEFEAKHAELIQLREDALTAKSEAELEIRKIVLSAYEAFPEGGKQFGDGMSVRINTTLKYDDQDAVKWAIAHEMPELLAINKTNFKKQASITKLDFVTEIETISAVVSF